MGFDIKGLIIILIIVALIFGTKKLRGMGGDIGGAVKGFKKAIKEDDGDDIQSNSATNAQVESNQKETDNK